VLRDARVDDRRLNIRVTQMLLNKAEIAAGPSMQLHATPVPERMRVQLGKTGPTAEGLDQLPDTLAKHAPLLCGASSREIPDNKHRLPAIHTGSFLREIFGDNGSGDFGQWDGRLKAALTLNTA